MRLFIYCAGGIGKEIWDIASRINQIDNCWEEICFIDDTIDSGKAYGTTQFTYEYFRSNFSNNENRIVIANGEPRVRKILAEKVKSDGYYLLSIIDKSARISQSAKIGQGVVIYPNTYISSEAVIGDNSLLSVNSCVGHNAIVGENVVVSTLTSISGGCVIGNNAYIGTKSVLKERIRIGEYAIIGMGACVFRDIGDEMIALGNPAREIKRNEDKTVF